MCSYPDRFFKLDYKVGVKSLLNKIELEQEEYLYREWLVDKPNLKDEYKHNFVAYKAKRTEKPLSKEDKENIKKRIDEQTAKIRKKVVK